MFVAYTNLNLGLKQARRVVIVAAVRMIMSMNDYVYISWGIDLHQVVQKQVGAVRETHFCSAIFNKTLIKHIDKSLENSFFNKNMM